MLVDAALPLQLRQRVSPVLLLNELFGLEQITQGILVAPLVEGQLGPCSERRALLKYVFVGGKSLLCIAGHVVAPRVFGDGLHGVALKVEIAAAPGHGEHAEKVFHLVVVHVFLRPFVISAAAGHVVEVEPLCRVAHVLHVAPHFQELCPRERIHAQVIKIGARNDVHLAAAVAQTVVFILREPFLLVLYAQQLFVGMHLSPMVGPKVARALRHLHGQHVEGQLRDLVARQSSRLFNECVGLRESHLLIGLEGQILKGVALLLPAHGQALRLQGQCAHGVNGDVAQTVGPLVEAERPSVAGLITTSLHTARGGMKTCSDKQYRQ